MNSYFKVSRDDAGICTLTFDLEGEKVNKLSTPVMKAFESTLHQLSQDQSISLLVITSSKPSIFIAGADIDEIKDIQHPEEGEEKTLMGQSIFNTLESLPFPTVAAINGACLGGGLELALACTYRIASNDDKTQLGLPEVNLGIIPGFGGTQRLPRLIGLQQALPLILTGKSVPAKKALKLRLVDKVVSQNFFNEEVIQFSKQLLDTSFQKSVQQKRKKKGLLTLLLDQTILGRRLVCRFARKDILKKTKGQYPAPLAALKVIEYGLNTSIKKGLLKESQVFGQVSVTSISKQLIQLFFTSESMKKYTGVDSDVHGKSIKNVAVLGAGLMGGGIAWLMSYRGFNVRVKDISWDAIGKSYVAAKKIYGQLVKRRSLTEAKAEALLTTIRGTLDYSGFTKQDVVVEAIVENMAVKKSVFKECEEHVSEDTIIASNTSSLSITEMSSVLKHPERFVGMHFFSPVNRMPLVEVIPGKDTSDETIATIVQLCKETKKTPIVVQDCPGFLVNRILIPYVNEAIRLLEHGAEIEELDAVAEVFGMPLGPLALADEVGLDVGYKVAHILEEGYGSRMAVAKSFEIIYQDESIRGKKSGKGFYLHDGNKKQVNPEIMALLKQKNLITNKYLSSAKILDRLMLIMVNEAARCLEEGIVASPELLDLAMIMGTGFPPFRGGLCRYADAEGLDIIVGKLEALHRDFGDRFKPADLLVKLSQEGKTIHKSCCVSDEEKNEGEESLC